MGLKLSNYFYYEYGNYYFYMSTYNPNESTYNLSY